MSKLQYYSMDSLIRYFREQGKEGDCWDFKQEWHDNIADLIKDVICFANTVHDENCYLIFGVADDLEITGMKMSRRKQADILDAISHLSFAGDVYPTIEVSTIIFEDVELDVLTIFNVENTPIYLKKPYGKMRQGCIYTRTGNKNTPNNGNADVADIENLWRKRLGLTKPPLEYIYDRLHNKVEWITYENGYYNVYRPEYTMETFSCDDNLDEEFYAHAMPNEKTSYDELNIKYQTTILKSYQIVTLDGGRLQIPTPLIKYICNNKYCYRYYLYESNRYRLLQFLYDPQNDESRYAFSRFQEVIVFFFSEEEHLSFEEYIEENENILCNRISKITQFDHVTTDSEQKTALYKEKLKIGAAMNELLIEWRKMRRLTE